MVVNTDIDKTREMLWLLREEERKKENIHIILQEPHSICFNYKNDRTQLLFFHRVCTKFSWLLILHSISNRYSKMATAMPFGVKVTNGFLEG
jgi:hypothetical protein